MLLIDRLIELLKDNQIEFSPDLIEDLKQTILDLKINRILKSDLDLLEIIAEDIMYGRSSLCDKPASELFEVLWDELEFQGYRCYKLEDDSLDCAEFDEFITDFLAKHLKPIELTKLLTRVNQDIKNGLDNAKCSK